jgi:endo-1,4-beta-xylanase
MSNLHRLKHRLKRRRFLAGLSQSVLGSAIAATSLTLAVQQRGAAQAKSSGANFDPISLRDRAAAKGLIYGAYTEDGYTALAKDPALETAFLRECALAVSGFWWQNIQPHPDRFDFTGNDLLYQFAQTHDLSFQGAHLLWHESLPQWLLDQLKNSAAPEIESVLSRYISTLVTRYVDNLHTWVVVNEAVAPADGREDGLRVTPWLEALGSEYIDFAFRTAAAANPNVPLTYNDNALEYDIPEHDAQRHAVLNLLEGLKSRGVPVHALGIQAHLTSQHPFSAPKFRSFLQSVADLGLKIIMTEMDVTDSLLPADIASRDRAIAAIYEDFLAVALDEPAVSTLVTWGLSDRSTWLSTAAPRPDGLPVRPLPLDSDLNRKLAWEAIARAIDACPPRSL